MKFLNISKRNISSCISNCEWLFANTALSCRWTIH